MKVTREQLIEMIKNNEDVSNIDMSYIFADNQRFNQDISKWDVSNVISMKNMFACSIFNGEFYKSLFNRDIYKFNLINVKNIDNMFGKSSFNKNIFNLKIIRNKNKLYLKKMSFIKNNLVIGEY